MNESVVIAVPTGDDVKAFWAYDLARMMAHTASIRPDIAMRIVMCSGSLIQKSREMLLDSALDTDATHVLFLDTDMRFPKSTLVGMLARDVPVVCANYTARSVPFLPVAFAEAGNWDKRAWPMPDKTGLEKVAACGFGVFLISRDAIKAVQKPRFMVGYNKETNGFIGEDVYFCLQLAKAGIATLVDNDLTKEVAHIGRFEFCPEHAVQFGVANELIPAPAPPKEESVGDLDVR